jgi:hypothetical protein
LENLAANGASLGMQAANSIRMFFVKLPQNRHPESL